MDNHEAFGVLIKQTPGWLDRPIEDLVKMRAVGDVYLTTHRSMLQKIKSGQIELAEEDRKARLEEGQAIGRALLDVEARIGELLPPPDETRKTGAHGGAHRTLPDEFGDSVNARRHKAAQARAIASHPEAVAAVIEEAEENEDIPTKTAVLNRIRYEREKERRENAPIQPRTILEGQELIIQRVMEKYIYDLREKMPSQLTEEGYKKLKALAMTINDKHREIFNGTETESISSRST